MIRFFIRHPTAANLLMLAMLLAGLLTLPQIKRETFPEFTAAYIRASVVYPGATPQEVEESLCMRMEDAVDGLSNIEEVRCRATEGQGILTLKLEEQADISRLLIDVQTQINAINDFPAETERPIVEEFDWTEPVIDLAITADTTKPDLKAYAEDIKRRLKVDSGISLVDIKGFSDHQLEIELKQLALRRLNLSVEDVATKLKRQNIKLPSGNIETADKNILIRFDERKITPETLATTIITSSKEGGVVRMGDIATITDRFELAEEHITFNHKPAAIVTISKNKADDTLRIKEQVVSFVDAERLNAPDGVTLTLTNDMSSLLWDRLTMLLSNGWQGVVLVFAVMWLFFSLRYSFWVAAGLPVAFLGGLVVMAQAGLSINIMSLVALLMAIGIMMDDAIVISESIAAHVERGLEIDEAVTQGVQKVLPGVLSSFFTTVCIFGGLMFLQGEMGQVLRVVPQVLLIILTLSLVEAFLILPNHLSHSLHKQHRSESEPGFKQRFLARFEAFRTGKLVELVSLAVKWRYVFLGAVLSLLLISFSLLAGGILRFVGFPELDGDIAEARIILPPGATLAQTEQVVKRIATVADQLDKEFSEKYEIGKQLLVNMTEQYNYNSDAGESGPHLATVRVDLLSAEIRKTRIDDYIDSWRERVGVLPEAVSLVFTQSDMGPGGRAIDVRIKHDDLEVLKAASLETQQYLAQFEGVSDLLDDMRRGKEEVLVKLRPGREVFGIDGQMIASQLRAAYFGQTADEIQVGPESIEIQVRLDREEAGDLQTLASFPIVLADGSQVPLATVATLGYERNFVRIHRIDGLRTINVMGDIDQRIASENEINHKLRTEFIPQLEERYPGLRFAFEGKVKENAKTGSSMLKGFLMGLFGVFAILSFQFRSYREPFIVLLAIPLALIGVLWGHLLLGYPLSMPSVMGFISLAGIVVNDSILLVQYIRHHVDQGESVHEAVISASRDRFRAVFLTSVTTAAGLLPLLLETSIQAQVVQPLVVSIVFGIFTSTLLVLFVIPAAYAVMADRGWVTMNSCDA